MRICRTLFVLPFLGVIPFVSASEPKDTVAAFFKTGPIPRFKISLDEANLAQIHKDPRQYVRATFEEGSSRESYVGVHIKGAAGSTRSFDDKPALTVSYDHYVQSRRYHGLGKFHLNNSVQDGCWISEIVCGELFLAAGVPTALGTHAVVELQGKPRGLYVLKEGYDSSFLKRHFKDSSGNLYDGGFLRDIDQTLKLPASHAGEPDYKDLKALVAACRERDLAQRAARLDKVLDIERFITMAALEMMTWHWDGYAMHSNNYRVYHDPKSDKLVFIPHGMDQMFGEPHGGISPPMGAIVSRSLFEIPEMRKRYYRRVGDLSASIFTVEKLHKRIDEVHDRVKPVFAEIDKGFVPEYDNRIKWYKDQVKVRAEFVEKAIKAKLEEIAKRPS